MAGHCSFCGSTRGPFSEVEGLFTVLMCADCQAARGYGAGPYPVMTRAEMRAGLDMLGRVPWSGGNEGVVVNSATVLELVARWRRAQRLPSSPPWVGGHHRWSG